jgi:ribulose-5-phosphate 4-epimerase/fuculose-1-phosphate aldolase
MTDLIYTHISARVPGPEHHFLINPYGLLFDEINASSLIKIDIDGNVISDPAEQGFNPAGFVIHSAIHKVREDAKCVMHTHSGAGVAVSAQADGLMMITQHAMRFHNRLAYHDYEGVALDMDEQQRLQAHLGHKNALILRNHGLLTCGETVADAFDLMYYLERACQAQIGALSGGAKVIVCSDDVAERVAGQFERPNRAAKTKHWEACLRLLDRTDPSYKH